MELIIHANMIIYTHAYAYILPYKEVEQAIIIGVSQEPCKAVDLVASHSAAKCCSSCLNSSLESKCSGNAS